VGNGQLKVGIGYWVLERLIDILPAYLPTCLPAYLPTCLPANLKKPISGILRFSPKILYWGSRNLSRMRNSPFLRGRAIVQKPIPANIRVTTLVDEYFQAYNAGRLGEACRLYAEKMLARDVTIGLSVTGALTPAGLGGSCIVPLMKAGFIDWIVSTGANLYHDTHFSIGHTLHRGSHLYDDTTLRKEGVIRIYDIVFPYEVLLDTDSFFRAVLRLPEFQKTMSTAEFHYLAGKYVAARERKLGIKHRSMLSAAYSYGVPVYTSSPGDSSIGMNVAALALEGSDFSFDVSADVNETAAIVLDAKRSGGKSAVLILGGGSPKNFMLQTEPQLQEVLAIKEKGHDYFLQITDARPDTGGLSGATPSEAVSWGKLDPDKLPDMVVAYLDSTVALPIMASYAFAKRKPRTRKELYHKRPVLMDRLRKEYAKAKR
jgi:deoxyhypusine synthase